MLIRTLANFFCPKILCEIAAVNFSFLDASPSRRIHSEAKFRKVIPKSSVPAVDPSELHKKKEKKEKRIKKKKPSPSLIIGTVKNSQAFIQVTDYVISTGCKTLRLRGSTALRGEL